MTVRTLLVLLLLVSEGCASSYSKRMVDSTPSTLVRLDTYLDPLKSTEVKNDHPAEWTDAGLIEVLERVMIAGGEEGTAPEKVLSYAEVSRMTPGLREAFHRAKPSEWVVFSVAQSKATYSRFTSGGLFIRGGKLHVMIANYRVRIPVGKTDVIDPNRAVPLRPIAGINRKLSFDPPQFVAQAQGGWVEDDTERPLGKLTVDHAAFLASLPPEQPPAPVVQAKPVPSPAASPAPAPALETQPGSSDAKIKRLEDEIERARLKLDQQAEELTRLRSRLGKTEGDGHTVPAKKPDR